MHILVGLCGETQTDRPVHPERLSEINTRPQVAPKNSSRPLAAQFAFKGHFLSKFSVFAEFIVYLPAATEFGVSAAR